MQGKMKTPSQHSSQYPRQKICDEWWVWLGLWLDRCSVLPLSLSHDILFLFLLRAYNGEVSVSSLGFDGILDTEKIDHKILLQSLRGCSRNKLASGKDALFGSHVRLSPVAFFLV